MELPDIEYIRELVELATSKKLDKLKVGDIEISKSRFDLVKPQDSKPQVNMERMNEDEILFYSTNTPSLTLEDIEKNSVNPMPIPRPKKGKK